MRTTRFLPDDKCQLCDSCVCQLTYLGSTGPVNSVVCQYGEPLYERLVSEMRRSLFEIVNPVNSPNCSEAGKRHCVTPELAAVKLKLARKF